MTVRNIIVSFRVRNEDIITFKKHQLWLNKKENEYFSTRRTLVYLLQKIKDIFEKKGIELPKTISTEFIDNLSKIGKKKSSLMITNPKMLAISGSEEERFLFLQIAYTIIQEDNIELEDVSYPYIFSRILQLNENDEL